MKKFNIGLLTFILFTACMLDKDPPLVTLSEEISEKIKATPGDFAVAFVDLKTGDTLFINERMSFHAASTMKTPVMIELYKQAAAGRFSLDDSILVKNEFTSIVDGSAYRMDISEDSETVLYKKVGTMLPIRELMYEMITKSSNLATNILIELVGAEQVTQSMRELGAMDITVLRGVEDQKAFNMGLSNTTTAYDLLKIFEAMGRDKIISESACAEMMAVLFDQQFNTVIPALLPKEVKVAHKTGSITGVQHDSGIIVLPNGHEYVVVLLSKNLENRDEAIKTMAEISLLMYNYVISDKHLL